LEQLMHQVQRRGSYHGFSHHELLLKFVNAFNNLDGDIIRIDKT